LILSVGDATENARVCPRFSFPVSPVPPVVIDSSLICVICGDPWFIPPPLFDFAPLADYDRADFGFDI